MRENKRKQELSKKQIKNLNFLSKNILTSCKMRDIICSVAKIRKVMLKNKPILFKKFTEE
jgi:hypothetical protein